MAVMRTGEWARARQLLAAGPQRLRSAIGVAIRQEAQGLRNEIVQGLTSQAPGGEPIKPPAPLTLAARQLEGFGGTKALLVRGDLRNSITVIVEGDEAFIGVPRSARSSGGESLVDLAQLHEYGGPPVVIPITPKMRRFLFALLRQAGKEPTGGSGRGVVVVQVPARPFLRPAFEKFREGASRRFLERVAQQLGFGGPV
jgi:phage gpG-like protein